MTAPSWDSDPTLKEIGDAVAMAAAGEVAAAKARLADLWRGIGPDGDPFHRCTLAHFMADLHDPAQA